MNGLLGDTLLTKEGPKPTAEALAGKVTGLYFSAHWCPPCRGFTPKLAEAYKDDLQGKDLEVVFVSWDKDETAFEEYYGEMPWVALPYADRDRREKLDAKFKVQGIPSLVILDSETGKVINKEGRAAFANDPTGAELPWQPKTVREMLGDTLLTKEGTKPASDVLAGKTVALYFSAHWCPPCRAFTPQLAQSFRDHLSAQNLAVVFISSDRGEDAFNEYYGEMPWVALPYAERARKEQLSSHFGVRGVPSLVILDSELNLITKEGRAAYSSDPTGAELPWAPKPLKDLTKTTGGLNECRSIVVLMEGSTPAEQAEVVKALEPIAAEYMSKAKAAEEEDPEVAFFIATKSGGPVGQIRKLCKLDKVVVAHEHPLAKCEKDGQWGCDGCGANDGERYRCTEACDFDYCAACHAAAASSGPVAPQLVLLDIPAEGAYYLPDVAELSEAAVRGVLDACAGGKLDRRQLGA